MLCSARTVPIFIINIAVQCIYFVTLNAGCSLQTLMNITHNETLCRESFHCASLSTMPQRRMRQIYHPERFQVPAGQESVLVGLHAREVKGKSVVLPRI